MLKEASRVVGSELSVAIAAAERAFEIADSAVQVAERAALDFGRVVDLANGWRDAAMRFFDSHNGWGHQCFCERCVPVRRMLEVQATSSMVE